MGCSGFQEKGGRRPGEGDGEFAERLALNQRMEKIRRKIIVLSGKGGVGKSTVAVNLAAGLAFAGHRVGLLDVDIHGPSVPTMLGLTGDKPVAGETGLVPLELGMLKVMSIGFLLDERDDAVIWRGPMKIGVIKQFLKDVEWGDLDFLVIDSPPGTGDEPLSVCQLIEGLDGAVIVTTPQEVAAADVRRSVTFCKKLGIKVLGIVENMAGFDCPHCGTVTQIFKSGGGRTICRDMDVPWLGSIPIDPRIVETGDVGAAFLSRFADSDAARALQAVIAPLAALLDGKPDGAAAPVNVQEGKNMRIAIPLAEGRLCQHFGHCASFALVDADPASGTILKREDIEAPPHEPGKLPGWLAERGAGVIIAGGMGSRAQELFAANGIRVLVGAPPETPESLVKDYLAGTLVAGANACDH